MPVPHSVYKFIPEYVRDLDTSGVLERFMDGIQTVWDGQHAKIEELDTLHNLDTIDDAYLTHLKHHVGWTAELDAITEALTADQLRKLIELSVPFWKRKGTEPGIRDALRLLTGRDVVIRNWFFYRWAVGVARLWRLGDERDPFLTGGTFGERDQYLTMIYVSTEVDVNKQLVRDLVNLHRPIQEAVKVVYCDLVDDFGVGRGKWTTVSGPELIYDSTRKLVTIPATTNIEVNVPSAVTWDETIWRNTMAFTGASGGEFVILFRRDPGGTNDRYRARFLQDGTVELAQIVGGVPTVLATSNVGHIIPQGETTTLGINIFRTCASDLEIGLWVYDTRVVSDIISEPDIIAPNSWRLENAGLDPIELDNVIAYQIPVHVDTIEGPGVVSDLPAAAIPAPCISFESSTFGGSWTKTSQWHESTFRATDGTTSLSFGTGETGYHTWGTPGAMGPGIVTGTATSPSFDASPFPSSTYEVYLEFWVWMDLRNSAVDDIFDIEVLDTGSPIFIFTPIAGSKSTPGWTKYRSANLAFLIAGSASVQVRYTLDTVTAPDPSREGVYIDQVRILIAEV